MSKITDIKKQNVILDTCILQYLDNSYTAADIGKIIESIKKGENKIFYSDYSIMELLTAARADREKALDEILKLFGRYLVDHKVFRAAAQLHALYRDNGMEEKQLREGDRVIAATAYFSDGVVVTANARDFPRPFFTEVHIEPVVHRGDTTPIYFLKPDVTLINEKFEKRKR